VIDLALSGELLAGSARAQAPHPRGGPPPEVKVLRDHGERSPEQQDGQILWRTASGCIGDLLRYDDEQAHPRSLDDQRSDGRAGYIAEHWDTPVSCLLELRLT